ncbi:hypothetical protein WJX72_004330 [[Myrmecia] bisecta]|uniref:FAS1 domain-containing protein n=1 Tax=[Myrmecia] bisecta TaxID=41462 RepID=A0AAW1PSW6_9CHLO
MWPQVDCSPPGNIAVKVDQFRQDLGGYILLSPQQVAGNAAIRGIALRTSAMSGSGPGEWRPMNNSYGAVWDLSGLYQPPFDVRITDSQGNLLVASNAIPSAAPGLYPTNIQLPTASKPAAAGAPAESPPPASPLPTAAAPVAPATLPPGVQAAATQPQQQCIPDAYTFLQGVSGLSQFLQLADTAGLTPFLKNPNVVSTLFVPVNSAFQALPPGVLINPDNPRQLQSVLLTNVALGKYPKSSFLVPTMRVQGSDSTNSSRPSVSIDDLNGTSLKVQPSQDAQQLQVTSPGSSAQSLLPDITTCNSVIHVMDKVLLP